MYSIPNNIILGNYPLDDPIMRCPVREKRGYMGYYINNTDFYSGNIVIHRGANCHPTANKRTGPHCCMSQAIRAALELREQYPKKSIDACSNSCFLEFRSTVETLKELC